MTTQDESKGKRLEATHALPPRSLVGPAPRKLRIALVYGRLPIPMKRADQVTVAHLIEFLSARGHQVDVFLLDGGEQLNELCDRWLAQRCRRIHIFRQSKIRSIISAIWGLTRRLPLQVGWFTNSRQRRAVRNALLSNQYDVAYCYYIRSAECFSKSADVETTAVRILAMQLSQSLNTRRMMEHFTSMRDLLVYSIESRLVRGYEARIWRDFERTVLIGQRDLDETKKVCRENNIPEIDNYILGAHGVDVERFAWKRYDAEPGLVAFAGAMGTNTNANAVIWFAKNVWPLILAQEPNSQFIIVGRNPRTDVRALGSMSGITVTGEVPNTAEYIGRAAVCVNPVFAGAGMQNKLLEFLALGKATVATSVANEGIGGEPNVHLLIADEPVEFANSVVRLLRDREESERLGHAARKFIEAEWTWETHWLRLEANMLTLADVHARSLPQSKIYDDRNTR